MDLFWKVILIAAVAAPVIPLAVMLRIAYRSRGIKRSADRPALCGAVGIAITDLAPSGAVMVNGELWPALAIDGVLLKKGAGISVVEPRGHMLAVALLQKS